MKTNLACLEALTLIGVHATVVYVHVLVRSFAINADISVVK